jgi:hypothetical protein
MGNASIGFGVGRASLESVLVPLDLVIGWVEVDY